MKTIPLMMVTFLFVMVFGTQQTVVRLNHRLKKQLSDAAFEELEGRTAIATGRVKGYAIRMKVGGGRFDPAKIGKKRRPGYEGEPFGNGLQGSYVQLTY